jgi:hypothetical protein
LRISSLCREHKLYLHARGAVECSLGEKVGLKKDSYCHKSQESELRARRERFSSRGGNRAAKADNLEEITFTSGVSGNISLYKFANSIIYR